MTRWTAPAERVKLTPQQRTRVFLKTDGHCADCGLRIDATRGDPFYCAHSHQDGKAVWQGNGERFNVDHFRPLCEGCWINDTGEEASQRADERRSRTKAITGRSKAPKGRPMPGTRASGWKRKMDGTWERRQ